MEATNKHTFKWLTLASVISAGLAVLLYFPFLIPALTVIIWLKFRGAFAMIPYFVYLAVTYFVGVSFYFAMAALNMSAQGFPVLFLVLFVCLTFPSAIVSVMAHRSGKRMYESVLQTTLVSFFGAAAFVALVYVYTDQNITTLILNALTQLFTNNTDILHSYFSQMSSFSSLFAETI